MSASATESRRLVTVLVRHGETEWNAVGRLQGQTDVPLSAEGREQARLLGERLRRCWLHASDRDENADRVGIPGPPRLVYSSDLSRAVDTARISLSSAGVRHESGDEIPILRLSDLRERSFGKFEGLTAQEAAERYPGETHRYAGELHAEVNARMRAAFDQIWADAAEAKTAREANAPVFVFGHGGSLRVLLAHAAGNGPDGARHFHLGNTGVTVIEWTGTDPGSAHGRFLRVNDLAHREP